MAARTADEVKRVIAEVARYAVRDRLLTYAAAMAFQALVALVPLTLLGLGLLGATGQADTWNDSIAPAIEKRVTKPVFEGIDYTARRILKHGNAGLIAFATALAIWYLAAAVRAIMEALNQIHEMEDTRPWWRRGLVSAALAIVSGAALIGSILAVVVAPHAARHGFAHWVLGVGRWGAAVFLLGLAVGLLVRYAPSEHPEPRWASGGSVLVIGSWIVATLIFRWFVSSVANFRSPSGSLTLLLVLNGYLFTTAMIFLLGAELDEVLREKARTRTRAGGGRRTRR
jgi:membrane protein